MKILSKINYWLMCSLLVFAVACDSDEEDDGSNAVPVVDVMPSSGAPSDLVLFEGTGLYKVNSITFNGIEGEISPFSSFYKIYVTVPYDEATFDLGENATKIVVNFDGDSFDGNFTTLPTYPVVESLLPASAVEGENVYVQGSGFTAISGVKVGNIDITEFTVASTTLITFKMPAEGGMVAITNPTGISESPNELGLLAGTSILISDFDGNGLYPSIDGFWYSGENIYEDNLESSEAGFGKILHATADGITWSGSGPTIEHNKGTGGYGINQTDLSKIYIEALVNLDGVEPGKRVFWFMLDEGWWSKFYTIEYTYAAEDYVSGSWVKISIPFSDFNQWWGADPSGDPIIPNNINQIRLIVSNANIVETTLKLDNLTIRYED